MLNNGQKRPKKGQKKAEKGKKRQKKMKKMMKKKFFLPQPGFEPGTFDFVKKVKTLYQLRHLSITYL